MAAIREFLNLAPLWLRGAGAFAAILFCLCAVLAIGYLKAPSRISQTTGEKRFTQKELDARVAQAVQEKVAELQDQRQQPKNDLVKNTPPSNKIRTATVRTVARYDTSKNTRNPRRPLTHKERQELAVDLRLLNYRDDDSLDLVGDKINQPW